MTKNDAVERALQDNDAARRVLLNDPDFCPHNGKFRDHTGVLLTAIREQEITLLALQTSRPDAREIAEAYKYNENDILDAQMIARSTYTMDERGRAEASLKHLYVIRAALQSGDKGRWMPIESVQKDTGIDTFGFFIPENTKNKKPMRLADDYISSTAPYPLTRTGIKFQGEWGRYTRTHWMPQPLPPTSEGV